MDYKKSIKDWFKNKDLLFKYREKTSWMFFIFSSLLFLTNLVLLRNRFNEELLSKTFIFTYFIFIISMSFFIYFLIAKNLNNKLRLILAFFLSLLFIILSISFSSLSI